MKPPGQAGDSFVRQETSVTLADVLGPVWLCTILQGDRPNARTCRRRRVDSWVWSVGPGGIPAAASRPAYGTRCRPTQPTRSAVTDAGIEGNSDNRTRTRSSNPSNTAPAGGLEYDGGPATPTPTRPSSARGPTGQRSLAATTLRHMKATDLRPLLHSDHPPNLGSGGPQLAERHRSPLQQASTAADRVRRAAQNRNRTRGLRCRLPLPPMRGKVQSAG